jgi:YfiH family protein
MSYLKADNLERFSTIEHGFGTAEDPWPDDIILMSQRHTNNVVIIEHEIISYLPVADAMLTHLPDKLIGVKTADCLPILLYNPDINVIGVIHAGWRGLSNMIIYNTIEKLRTFYNASLNHTYFSIGPAICKNCYEVGMEVVSSISSTGIDLNGTLKKVAKDKVLLNTREVAHRQLHACGVPDSNISHINLCTKCSPGFHSHRAGSKERQVSYIKLK